MSGPPPAPGVLPVDKPSGPGSREVVNRVVRVLGHRRVGHAGTLDPMASGLLLLAWGRATALVPYLQEHPKTYEAEVRFGRATDTQDRTGTTLEEHDPAGLDAAAVEAALGAFRGTILQVPPMYSALKRDGARLYELAREGVEVAREPREREVLALDLLAWRPPVARLRVRCSAGTYVRTLAHDLGRALGPGACLDELRRTGVGPFAVGNAVPLDAVDGWNREELLARALPPAAALPDWPELPVAGEEERSVRHGSWRDPRSRAARPGRYRIVDGAGRLLALAAGGTPPKLLRVLAEAVPR